MTYIEQFWRNATAADVARALAGEVVEARFRDSEIHVWTSVRRLIGARAVDVPEIALRWLDCASGWRYCQAYAPPQWFVDNPEPGEDYRLLGKFPDEPVQGGDFFKNAGGRWIELANGCNPTQQEGVWYRRRIEQPKPEPKFAVGQRVRVVGPKQSPAVNWDRQMDKHNGAVAEVISVSSVVGSKVFYDLRFIEQWAFREDYLEPAVEPKHYVLQVGDTAEFPDGAIVEALEKGGWIKRVSSGC